MSKKTEGHTPGPWKVHDVHPLVSRVSECGKYTTELVVPEALGRTEPIERANAHLIAAAPLLPELVEALRGSTGTLQYLTLNPDSEDGTAVRLRLEQLRALLKRCEEAGL